MTNDLRVVPFTSARRERKSFRFLMPLALLFMGLGWSLQAHASGISYTCDSSISASACSTLQTTTAGLYSSTFTNANATIYITMGSIGGVAESNQFEGVVSYGTYRTQLIANDNTNSTDSTFQADDVPATEPSIFGPFLFGPGSVQLTTALANAIGITDTFGIDKNGNSCAIGAAGCYDGLVTMSNSVGFYYRSGSYTSGEYDFFTAAEHETDEILGTSSCLGTGKDPTTGNDIPIDRCTNGTAIAPADLGRFSGNGTRSWLTTANGTTAYFSIDGGATVVEDYNNSPNGNDYGDWLTNCKHVQDAAGCNSNFGFDITNDGGVEVTVLDAVGYTTTPEPGTLVLLGVGLLALLALSKWSKRRKEDYAS